MFMSLRLNSPLTLVDDTQSFERARVGVAGGRQRGWERTSKRRAKDKRKEEPNYVTQVTFSSSALILYHN